MTEMKISSKSISNVSFVLCCKNQLTGKNIESFSLNIITKRNELGIKYIKKENGYIVFMNLEVEKLEFTICSEFYEQYYFTENINNNDSYNKFKTIYLRPNYLYNYPKDVLLYNGVSMPNKVIYFVKSNEDCKINLLNDLANNENNISFFNPRNVALDGRKLLISEGEFTLPSIIEVTQTNTGGYVLISKTSTIYKKVSSNIRILYSAITDDCGNYFIALQNANWTKNKKNDFIIKTIIVEDCIINIY